MSLYKNPEYYEIAFSFRNIPKEVDFFEEVIKKFSKVKVRRVFELASGNSPHLEEWYERGYEYIGLDLNREMLNFVRARAKKEKIKAILFQADMGKFSLGKLRADLAYVSLGSLYVKSNDEFFRHLDSVAKVLRSGGAYIMDGVVWFDLFGNSAQKWAVSKRGIKVKATFRADMINQAAQIFRENITLDILDHGRKKRIRGGEIRKFFFPQEFLSLIKCHGKFEFMGWFNDFDINKCATPGGRQIMVLRKK
jgi:hypothetical protein